MAIMEFPSSETLEKPHHASSGIFRCESKDDGSTSNSHTEGVQSHPLDIEVGIKTSEKAAETVPRADGGKDAWLFLAGCFVFEALVWGFPFCFGVFESYYTTHAPFDKHPDGIAIVGTCATGVMYLFAPITVYFLESWPSIRRLSSICGLLVVLAALVASTFSTQVWHLIFTQGVLYAVGGSFLYAPTIFYLDEWFVEKKGLAFGVMWAGCGSSGLVFPFLLNYLLGHFGHAWTLRIWSLILFLVCTPLIFFIKPRLPPSPAKRPSYNFLLSPTHFLLQLSNILESLGFFIPSIYLPLYSTSLSLSQTNSTLLLSLLNLFSVFGAVGMGWLCDRLHVSIVVAISCLGASLAVFVLWGLGGGMGILVGFVGVYGICAGGFSAIWSGMMKEIMKKDSTASMGSIMGILAAGRGIGSVACGPLSEILLKNVPTLSGVGRGGGGGGGGGSGFQSKFGILIVFTGVSAMAGLIGVGAAFCGRERRRRGAA